MVDTEDYFMFKDLAREQEQTTGRVNISELSRETGFDRKTVRHYLSQDIPPETSRTRNKPSKLDPYKPHIKDRLEKYPRLSRVRFFEEIQKQGYDGKPTILGDYLRQIRPRIPALPEIRYETLPGEMIQCDWLEYLYSRPDGSEKKVYGFSMVLGYSRMRYVEFSRSQDLQAFLEGHLRAFEYFGGIPKVILYDNLGSVVLKRKYPSTASEFHPAFVDLRDHFGFTSRLCRLYRAKTKGKVERSIGYIKDNFLYGREFNSVEDINLQAREWMDVVNRKVHGTTHEIPFDRLPQENLRPFTSYPSYIFQKTYQRKVSNDCYISLYRNLYSVPWRYARRFVDVVVRNNTVFVFADEAEICFHPLVEGKNQRSKKNEHFAGLLKKILDEPCQNPKKNWVKIPGTEPCSVVERNLADYDALIEVGNS
jgi:transposase